MTATPVVAAVGEASESFELASPGRLVWRRLRGSVITMTALGALLVLVVAAVFAPVIQHLAGLPGPNVQDPSTLSSVGLPTGPSWAHPLGVDNLGRDVASRLLYGARVSLIVGLVATGIAAVAGTLVGLFAGFYGGILDTLLSRVFDLVLAFPMFLLALGLSSSCGTRSGCVGGTVRPGLTVVIAVIALATWPYVGRLVRAEVLSLRQREFVEAGESLGLSDLRLMFGEVLPNLVAPLLVYVSLIVPTNILFEAALSFLGVGVRPPTASWGSMIAQAVPIYQNAWWFLLFPGAALLMTVLAFNFVGDALQDAIAGAPR